MGRYVNASVILHTLDTVISVEILVKRDLEDGRPSLTRGDRRRSEEVLPDTEPPSAVLGDDGILITQPILIPPPERRRVMNTEDINILHLKASGFDLSNNPAKRAAGVRSWEDILVH